MAVPPSSHLAGFFLWFKIFTLRCKWWECTPCCLQESTSFFTAFLSSAVAAQRPPVTSQGDTELWPPLNSPSAARGAAIRPLTQQSQPFSRSWDMGAPPWWLRGWGEQSKDPKKQTALASGEMKLLKKLSLYQSASFSGVCFAPFYPDTKVKVVTRPVQKSFPKNSKKPLICKSKQNLF